MTTKHTPGPVFISPDQVHELNEKHGWFEFGDAQSDVSNAFANEAIARYERIRSAAPEMLEALEACQGALEWAIEQGGGPTCEHEAGVCFCKENNALNTARAAIAKAKGEQQ